ncbi:hypothetical protein K9M41_01925 [Candidatus Gracilibacteria bacterium]|nr:hypothetical protein [Candidatus Gracilibacteria bacterium]
MEHKIKVGFYTLASLVLIINGIFTDISVEGLAASVVKVDEAFTALPKELNIDGKPDLVKNVKTYVNRNGYEVFHGYEYGDLTPEETIEAAREFNAKRRYRSSAGIRAQRTPNYRYLSASERLKQSDLHASATAQEKKGVARVRTRRVTDTLTDKKQVGWKPEVKVKKTVRGRISLRQTDRLGTALRHRVSKQKTEEYQEWASEVWRQNRVLDTSDPKLLKGISKLKIKNVRESREVPLFYVRPEETEEEETTDETQIDQEESNEE